MKWRETAKMKLDVCLAEEQRKCEVYCPYCGWKNHIYAFEKEKKLCKNCKRYIFKDEKSRFKHKVKEVMNKCKSSN